MNISIDLEDLKEIVKISVEEALTELFSDPDAGLELRADLRERLLKSEKNLEPDLNAEDIMADLDLSL